MPIAGLAAGYGAGLLGQQVGLEDGFRASIACSLGVLATLAVNPDLDLLESSFKSKVRKKFLLLPWWILWIPYSTAIPHRSPLSHAPLLGTFLRVVYLVFAFSLVLAVLVIANLVTPETIFESSSFPRWFFLWFIAGMTVSDTVHWLLDVVSS
jgi:uncharacterized metal-binding protein